MVRDTPREPPSLEAIADFVETHLGWTVSTVTRFEEGLNAVYRVDRHDGDAVVVKTATVVSDDALLVEATLHAAIAAETGVPVPAVLETFEREETSINLAAFVMEYRPGRTVTDIHDLSSNAQERLIVEAGHHHAELHGARIVDGFGPLALSNGDVVADPAYPSWGAWFEARIEQALDGMRGVGVTKDSRPQFSDLETEVRSILGREISSTWEVVPAIFFGDYRPANLVLSTDDESRPLVKAVVDVGAGPTGDGLLDLALAEDALVDIPFGGTDRADLLRMLLRDAYSETRHVDADVFETDQYTRYRLYARARRMGSFGYWGQFVHEDDRDIAARRWQSTLHDLVDDLE